MTCYLNGLSNSCVGLVAQQDKTIFNANLASGQFNSLIQGGIVAVNTGAFSMRLYAQSEDMGLLEVTETWGAEIHGSGLSGSFVGISERVIGATGFLSPLTFETQGGDWNYNETTGVFSSNTWSGFMDLECGMSLDTSAQNAQFRIVPQRFVSGWQDVPSKCLWTSTFNITSSPEHKSARRRFGFSFGVDHRLVMRKLNAGNVTITNVNLATVLILTGLA